MKGSKSWPFVGLVVLVLEQIQLLVDFDCYPIQQHTWMSWLKIILDDGPFFEAFDGEGFGMRPEFVSIPPTVAKITIEGDGSNERVSSF